MGRLFDAAAALVGFTRAVSFEGQAAIWLEQLARPGPAHRALPVPVRRAASSTSGRCCSPSPADRARGRDRRQVARAFHAGVAQGLADALSTLAESHGVDTVAVSGGVFQNQLLLSDLAARLEAESLTLWTNRAVPPNDGGISLGQAALACMSSR